MIKLWLKTAILSLYLSVVFVFKVLPRWWFFPRGKKKDEEKRAGQNQKPRLLYISFIEWEGAYQRPQHLVSHLSKYYQILYVSLCRLHHWAKRPGWWKIKKHTYRTVDNAFQVLTPLAFPLDKRLSGLQKLNNMIIFSHLLNYDMGTNWDIVLINAPYYNELIKRTNYQRLVYDVMDELTEMTSRKAIKAAEAWLIKRAAVVTSGTYSLYLRKKEQHPRVQCIMCGVDYEHFAQATRRDLQIPPDITNVPKPILGYFGAINERLDFALLTELARSIPRASIVLIGPVYRGKKELKRFSNIHLLGHRPYSSLPSYLKAFDVALVPYRLTKGVKYVNPVKVLEYLAGGKPVLSTAIADIKRFYAHAVLVAETKEEFIHWAQRMANSNITLKDRIERGQALARQRSWAQMAAEFHLIFQEISQ